MDGGSGGMASGLSGWLGRRGELAIASRAGILPLFRRRRRRRRSFPCKRFAAVCRGMVHNFDALFLPLLLLVIFVTPPVAAIVFPSGVLLQRLSPAESAQLGTECGHSTEMLANGREHPWAVSIMTKGRNKLGGTIISPFHILTVAHGFLRFDNPCEVFGYRRFENVRSTWTVVYGSDCIRTEADDPVCSRANVTHNRIRAIFVDDGFADGGCVQGHDWALVELEQRIHFSAQVQPICLPLSGAQRIPEGQLLTVTSWGRRDAFHKGDILIREIPMRHDAECKKRPWADNMPTEVVDYLCAKALDPRDFKTLRTCHGDSGSGMEWRRPSPLSGVTRVFRGMEGNGNGNGSSQMPPGNDSVTNEEENPVKRLSNQKQQKRVNGTRQVMHSPLLIPELEFMRKWPIVVKAAPHQNARRPIPLAAGDEVVRLLDSVGMGEAAAGQRTGGGQGQCELVGTTSYGSRQCASDELARFTRISRYLEKICALTGVCYPLGTTEAMGK